MLKYVSFAVTKMNSKNFSFKKTILCLVMIFALLYRLLDINVSQMSGVCLLTVQKFD